MPAAQVIDLSPVPNPAFANFGKGFGNQLFENYREGKENDAVQEIINKYRPGMESTEFLRETMGVSGLSLDKKKSVFDMIQDVEKQQRQLKDEQSAKSLSEQAALEFAQNYGIPPAVAKRLAPKDMAAIIKDDMKNGPISPDVLNQMTAFNKDPNNQNLNDLDYRNAALAYGIPQKEVDRMVNIRQKSKANDANQQIPAGQRMQFYGPTIAKIRKESEDAQKKLYSFAKATELIKTGKVGPQNPRNFLARTLGEDSIFYNLIRNPEDRELDTIAYQSIVGTKEDFGVRLSDADLRIVQNKIIGSELTPEMNLRIIKYNSALERAKMEKAKIVNEILKENGGAPPMGFDVILDERMKQSAVGQEIEKASLDLIAMDDSGKEIGVWMVDPETGERELIDKAGVKDMEKIGFKRI